MVLVRFEDLDGTGLFRIAGDFDDHIVCRFIRLKKKIKHEVVGLIGIIRNGTPPAPAKAYSDRRCRNPITWFRVGASPVLAAAERLVMILNREGANLRRIETDRPPPILWMDDVQVVTRRPRRNTGATAMNLFKSREIDRRKKLERFRRRAGRNLARRMKSGI